MSNLYKAANEGSDLSESFARSMRVLSQTYMLTALGLCVTAMIVLLLSSVGVAVDWPVLVVGVVGMFAFLYIALGTCDSAAGLFWSVLFYASAGALIYPAVMVAPADVVALAAASAGGTFFLASAYAYLTKTDFSNIGGFLVMALIALILMGIANIFIASPLMQLALAWVGVLVFIGFILFDTSEIIHGRETNYIRAALGMYLNIMNLFLDFLTIFAGDGD